MSDPHGDLRLRMEMLRLRGELQRADAIAALDDVRERGRGVHDLIVAVFRVGAVSRSGADSVVSLTSALRDRPWLLGLAMFALRVARRHPVATVVAAAAAITVRMVLRPAVRPPDDPADTARD